MIKTIVQDPNKLFKKCISSTGYEYKRIAKDLLDTALYNKSNCVGLAANQIGYNKRVIAALINDQFIIMINPIYIVKCGGIKADEETCLSFPGKSSIVRRYKKVRIKYYVECDDELIPVVETFTSFEARIIQHEIDHLNGILR